jgi:hypothetical protein
MLKASWPLAVLVLCAATLSARGEDLRSRDVSAPIGPPMKDLSADCSEGVRYDDGTFDVGYKFNSLTTAIGSYAMAFDVPPGSPAVKSVCICWFKDAFGTETANLHGIKVWAADGPGGSPGTILGSAAAAALPLTTGPVFYRTELSIPISSGRVWIGPEWLPGEVPYTYLCADQHSATSQPAYRSESSASPYENVALLFPAYKNLGIRAVFADPGACVPSDTVMCLNNQRFKVEASFTAPGQVAGSAHGVKLTDATGYFWFFDSTNVEMVVKVLNACVPPYNHYWVFAGGLTNVAVTLTVTDTMNGTVKIYNNPQKTEFQPIQDAAAFATCP